MQAGHVEVDDDMAEDLLRAADQYMLEGLKSLCERALEQKLSVETLHSIVETSENFNAQQLNRKCVLFALANYAELFQVLTLAHALLLTLAHAWLQPFLPGLQNSSLHTLKVCALALNFICFLCKSSHDWSHRGQGGAGMCSHVMNISAWFLKRLKEGILRD